MKQTLLKTVSLILVVMVLTNCDTEEIIKIQEPISAITTVTSRETLSLFHSSDNPFSILNPDKKPYAFPHLERTTQEEIMNSKELLTVIPASTNKDQFYSRILLLKINGDTKSIVLNMLPNAQTTTDAFFGKIFIMDLDGNFINGYKVEHNILISQYKKPSAKRLEVVKHELSKKSGNDCPFEDDNLCDLEEVVITASSGPKLTNIPLNILFYKGGLGTNYTWDPWSGGSGGTGCSYGYFTDSNGTCIEQIPFDAPDNPIDDMTNYLDCFDLTKGAQLTIYVDQPIANSEKPFTSGDGKAGHAFIGIAQNGITRTWGLYPEGRATPFSSNDPHSFGNDQGHAFDVSISLSINFASLENITNYAINYTLNYDLNTNNCTDYVLDVARLCGLTLPDPQSTWTNGGGSNPGAFGEDLREMALPNGTNRDDDGGTAPQNSPDCI